MSSRVLGLVVGAGVVASYGRRPDGSWTLEGPRPGPGWHRHDWRKRRLLVLTAQGPATAVVHRRRWRRAGTTATQLDRAVDEVGAMHAALLVVLLKLWSWLRSHEGLHRYDEVLPSLERHGSRRTVQRWLRRLAPDGLRLQQALRTAVLERLEPQPVEKLFPGGVPPPVAVRRRRWKDPDAVYPLATALAFLVEGAVALATSATVLLAEALRRLEAPLGIPAR